MSRDIISLIEDQGIVAVVRAKSTEDALKISRACLEGGISAIEVTYTVPDAAKVIRSLAQEFDNRLILGAGTILNSDMAKEARTAGAEYLVSPGFDQETAEYCLNNGIPYFPGCLTVTEMMRALAAGMKMIKLFPGSAFGPAYVKAIKGPLPGLKIMPTGGVSIENLKDWFRAGVCAVGVGGELTSPAVSGDYEGVSERARAFKNAIQNFRDQNVGK